MIRSQRIDAPRANPLPQLLRAEHASRSGGAHLAESTNLTDRLVGQQQIMRAGFCGHPDTAISGTPDQINSFRATHVNNVQVATDLASKIQGDPDGAQFRLDRTRSR